VIDGTEKVEDFDEEFGNNSLSHLKLSSQKTDSKFFSPEKKTASSEKTGSTKNESEKSPS